MQLLSLAAFAATAHASASWLRVDHKDVRLMGAVGDWDFLSEPVPEPPSEQCTTYIPDEKFDSSDLTVIMELFQIEYVEAGRDGWDWTAVLENNGFKSGMACSYEKGQVFAIETKGEIGWWHPDAFEATSQPYSYFKLDGTCDETEDQVYRWPLVVYACENEPVATAVDGNWAEWTAFDSCSLTCDGGSQSRSRTCTNPAAQNGGEACVGDSSESQTCNTQSCPVDGNWAEWTAFDSCSLTCDGGSQSRSRTCTNPAAQHGGAACVGESSENQSCNDQSCPGISAKCNDDNTISVKIDYDQAGSILSATYGSCNASELTGADASNVKTWDVTLNPSRCGMESKLRTLDYNQTAKFTVGRKDGNSQIKFATFEIDSYCSYTSEYTVTFDYGPISADSFDFTDSGGLLGLNFYIASYSNGSFAVKADPSSQAGKTIYLKLALNATLNADFDHATSMDASSGKVFVPTMCAVEDANSNRYTLFDTSSSAKCVNDYIDLAITYNSGDGQSWNIEHTLFLLNDGDTSTYSLSCNVLVCDAAEITDCKTAYNCLTNSGGD